MTNSNPNGPHNLATTPIHLGNTTTAVQHNFGFDGPAFGAYVEKHSNEAEPGRLAMIEESPENWGAWEWHTAGDTVINPKGILHTANVTEPMRAIYLTPCYGTEHRPR